MPNRPIPVDRLVNLDEAERGLTVAEVSDRRARFGFNDIIAAPPSTWIDLVRDTAGDPMIWFLVGVSALFTLLGDYTEAAILAVALVPLAGMDTYLHRRTQASTRGLASRLAALARVLRDGDTVTIPAREIVPGDLVEVSSGEHVPADGLVVTGRELQVDESSLTGATYPVRKRPITPILAALHSAEASHWVFAGTRLLTGKARVRVVTLAARRSMVRLLVRLSLEPTLARRSRSPLLAWSTSCS
jgi:Ca2+-transporting ATPase